MSLPRARFLPSGAVELTFPYCRPLIEGIKARIPAEYRSYDPATKAWTVAGAPDWTRVAVALLRRFYPDAGGDTAAMQRLNAAYGRLRERVAS